MLLINVIIIIFADNTGYSQEAGPSRFNPEKTNSPDLLNWDTTTCGGRVASFDCSFKSDLILSPRSSTPVENKSANNMNDCSGKILIFYNGDI